MLARNIVPNTVCSEHLFGTDVRNRQCSERGPETVFGTDVRNRCSVYALCVLCCVVVCVCGKRPYVLFSFGFVVFSCIVVCCVAEYCVW